jgi:hypothetical protein
MLVKLTAVRNKVSSGVRDPDQIFANQSVETVVRAWADLREKGDVPLLFPNSNYLHLTRAKLRCACL